eukprot:TRINITY_DN7733_c0_g1_i1.p1 TRINITY_DN7733_c0_g1~~TRINITY_DN7733_c0_g1_i1.p1  ORF type:complete len:312 (+),score=52.61 TRINITY_DN7733_c0_g1_i1:68-1003(+)
MASIEDMVAKTGADLFKELLRHFSEAEVEDYYKNGAWKDEDLRLDLQLILQHRREAGAPDPPELDEVEMPELPTAKPLMGLAMPGVAKLAVTGMGGGIMEDIKEIALLVGKTKMDPVKAKMALSKLAAPRRKYVLENFSTTETGEPAFAAMEQYIKDCEKENKWPAAPAVAATPAGGILKPVTATPVRLGAVAPAVGALRPNVPAVRPVVAAVRPALGAGRPAMVLGGASPAAATGVKRPIILSQGGNPAMDASKRPRLTVGTPAVAGGVRAPLVVPRAGMTPIGGGPGPIRLGGARPPAAAGARGPIRLG